MNEKFEAIIEATKEGALDDRQARIQTINDAIDEYITTTGKTPDNEALERLADAILHEELTDTNRMKIRNNEYPFMSDTQLSRRQEGKHERKGKTPSGEVPLRAAANVGTDGRNHHVARRKRLTVNDSIAIDKEARSRNQERKRRYNDFIKVQPVITYKINE
jgi:hypothetical protein